MACLLTGSCGFVCQNSYSCVQSICTNTNFGKKLLGEEEEDEYSALPSDASEHPALEEE